MVAERIDISGLVQGVGFRPFVFRVATDLGLCGRVGNNSSSVFIEAVGPRHSIDCLVSRIADDAPPMARVESLTRSPLTPEPDLAAVCDSGFVIVASRDDSQRVVVPPDAATCTSCLDELHDVANRRFRHPFITCTDCGPRFTIIRGLPYDRPSTTMAAFDMCDDCAAEYGDPADRRHHAQPISCHRCGPTLRAEQSGDAMATRDDALQLAAAALRAGRVVAVKGIGGFHLVCDASNDHAVAELRRRKHRPDKPFAVMVRDIEGARALGAVGAEEAAELESPAAPIVLLTANETSEVSPLVAPDNPLVGVVLAYSPVHHLLLGDGPQSLVVTSANVAGEPIIHRDDERSSRQLSALADLVLTHDRPIDVPCDDSVVRIVGGTVMAIRRGRGHAPLPVKTAGTAPVLAVGGELKNTFCLAAGGNYWVSQHIGDMGGVETMGAFEAEVDRFSEMYGITPSTVVADTHPRYMTTRWAHRQPGRVRFDVQHHHAHVASVMAEHDLDPRVPVVGFAFDGTGHGDDGSIWGGEVLVANAVEGVRVAHLRQIDLPGGDAAIEHPCRSAMAHLDAAGIGWTRDLAPVAQFTESEVGLLRRQLDRRVACVATSSMGRLFDAIASLLDLRHRATYEAHAAIALEIAASTAAPDIAYRFDLDGERFDAAPVVRSVVADLVDGVDVAVIARRFHEGVAELIHRLAIDLTEQHAVGAVVLTGGVFQNALLVERCLERLDRLAVPVLTNSVVPPNDGGLALGQAFVASNATILEGVG